MKLTVENLTVGYGSLTVLDGASFSLTPGDWLMLVGPNGAGKSTTLSALCQAVPYTGRVLLDGADAGRMKPRALARRLGILRQSQQVGYAFTVEEIVRLGRYAYSRGLSAAGPGDQEAVEAALAAVGMTDLRNQNALTLSGGELQRAFLAQLLAQNPAILLLDEPASHLDLFYRRQVFNLVADWIRNTGGAVISVVHDLSLAKAYGTQALLLQKGKTLAYGPADQTLSRQNLAKAYGLDVYAYMGDMLSLWKDE